MREIPEKYRDSIAGKALREAQAEFLRASQDLVEANRTARTGNYTSTDEVESKASLVVEAEERMKAAEAAFDLATGGPEPVALTDVVRGKVQQSFPTEQQSEVTRLLETECANNLPFRNIGTDEGLERIRLAVLKVANGSESELRRQIDVAKRDWRDVINEAEYPEAARLGLLKYSKLDEKTREQIQQRDRQQYLAWLGQAEPSTPHESVWRKLWRRKRNTDGFN